MVVLKKLNVKVPEVEEFPLIVLDTSTIHKAFETLLSTLLSGERNTEPRSSSLKPLSVVPDVSGLLVLSFCYNAIYSMTNSPEF